MKLSTDARLTIKNFELSILFRGEDVPALLAGGGAWDSIVTYVRPARPYRVGWTAAMKGDAVAKALYDYPFGVGRAARSR